MQTSGAFPESFPAWTPQHVVTVVQKLGDWASYKPMEEVCWISFCSLGLAYFVESFVRKLDELANGTVDDSPFARQMSPYNLVCAQSIFISLSYQFAVTGCPFLRLVPFLTSCVSRLQTRRTSCSTGLTCSHHTRNSASPVHNGPHALYFKEAFQPSANSYRCHIFPRPPSLSHNTT